LAEACVAKTESIQTVFCFEGLEQAKDTFMPTWSLIQDFAPLLKISWPAFVDGLKVGLLAPPYLAKTFAPFDIQKPLCFLALGPGRRVGMI